MTKLAHPGPRRRRAALAGLVAILLAALAAWFAAYRYFVSEELAEADGRLSLYRSTVLAEIERFDHLAEVLSVDPFVIDGLVQAPSDQLNARLIRIADAAGVDAIFLMRPDGLTIAASNAGTGSSFVGENYAFRPYFQDALAGGRGQFYGIGATTGLPGYFIADPVWGLTKRFWASLRSRSISARSKKAGARRAKRSFWPTRTMWSS